MGGALEQQTLAQAFTLAGIGIHTGANGKITVHPADSGFGRVFRIGQIEIAAHVDHVVDTTRSTTLGTAGARVHTVEHLLSALNGLGVDNALIEVEGPEIPILDGSAMPFVEAILSAGIHGQGEPCRVLGYRTDADPLLLSEGSSSFTVEASDTFRIAVTTEFANWPEGKATVEYEYIVSDSYAAVIAPARTFAFREEVEHLLKSGLAQGGSLDNALIITPPDEFSTPLRLPQEWCAHKLLDVLGDLALVGARLQIAVTALRPGHRTNIALARRLLFACRELPAD